MSEIKKICESIVKSKNYSTDSHKKKILYARCLNVENQMFKVYMKTGKCSRNNFPIESLGKVLFTSQNESQKIAKMFIEVGWSPTTHVTLTRNKFKDISYIGKSISY